MLKRCIPTISLLFLVLSTLGQRISVEFTFHAVENTTYIPFDSVKMKNISKGDSTTIHWPDSTVNYLITPGDTLLYIGYSTRYPVSIRNLDLKKDQFQIFQSVPENSTQEMKISIYLPAKGKLALKVVDLNGRIVNSENRELGSGFHTYQFIPGEGYVHILTANFQGIQRSLKLISIHPYSTRRSSLEYLGENPSSSFGRLNPVKQGLLHQESGILDTPSSNKNYTFQFATNIPCPWIPTVNYGGCSVRCVLDL